MKKHEFKIEITADISKVSEVYEAVSLVEGVEIKVLDCIEVKEAVRPKVTGAKRGRKKQKYKVEEDPNAVTIYKNGKYASRCRCYRQEVGHHQGLHQEELVQARCS